MYFFIYLFFLCAFGADFDLLFVFRVVLKRTVCGGSQKSRLNHFFSPFSFFFPAFFPSSSQLCFTFTFIPHYLLFSAGKIPIFYTFYCKIIEGKKKQQQQHSRDITRYCHVPTSTITPQKPAQIHPFLSEWRPITTPSICRTQLHKRSFFHCNTTLNTQNGYLQRVSSKGELHSLPLHRDLCWRAWLWKLDRPLCSLGCSLCLVLSWILFFLTFILLFRNETRSTMSVFQIFSAKSSSQVF